MPSAQLEDAIRRLRADREDRTDGPPPLDVLRANFAPGAKPFPMPSDEQVERAITDDGSADWLIAEGMSDAPEAIAAHRIGAIFARHFV